MMNKANMKKPPSKDNISNRKGTRPSAVGQNSSQSSNLRNIHSANSHDRLNLKNLNPNSNIHDFINDAIQEYLFKRDLYGTLEVFKDELHNAPGKSKTPEVSFEAQLLELFDKGQRELFFSKWNKLIPASLRMKDDECNKLEFYIHIYFVVFGAHPNTKKSQKGLDKGELQNFKLFLDTKGADLAQTSEFLPYYALPYVANPTEHPSFKHVFTKEWIVEVRQRLEEFLQTVSSQDSQPTLVQMYQVFNKQGGQSSVRNSVQNNREKDVEINEYKSAIAQLETSNKELMNILNEFNTKYGNLLKSFNILQKNEEIARNNLFESHSKWINFSKELLAISKDMMKVVDHSKNGIPFQDHVLDALRNKILNYEAFLNSNIEDLTSQSQDQSAFDKFSTSQDFETPEYSSYSQLGTNPMHQQIRNVQLSKLVQGNQYCSLDFDQIDKCFASGTNEGVVCALLQALRWRITRTKGANIRREVIISFSKHDILGLMRDNNKIINRMFVNANKKIKEYTARFINALASDYCGRTYLLEAPKTVLILIDSLKAEKGDTIIRRNCLGALQKLSLRRKPQIVMIDCDLIKWIIQTLKKEKHTLSEYSYEYATALFMNLSLRAAGKKQCEDPSVEVLSVFSDLLEHENLQVRTFVNGTLYSLLSRPALKEQAKAMGMNEMLDYLMENSEERFKKQIQYIKDQLNNQKSEMDNDDASSDSNEDENDIDDNDDDEEIGEDDDVEDNLDAPGVVVGEDLLNMHFALSGPEALRQTSMIQEAMEDTRSLKNSRLLQVEPNKSNHPDRPLHRPTTPSMVNKIYGDSEGIAPELQSRPRILRTPMAEDKPQFQSNLAEQVHQQQKQQLQQHQDYRQNSEPNLPLQKQSQQPKDLNQPLVDQNKIKPVAEKHREQNKEEFVDTKEFRQAFESRPRVVRTPPASDYFENGIPSMYDYGHDPQNQPK